MKNLFLSMAVAAVWLTGCTNSGAFVSGNQTIGNLNEDNYSITAPNVSGEAEASYLFGLSYSSGFVAHPISIARVDGTGKLYAEALETW